MFTMNLANDLRIKNVVNTKRTLTIRVTPIFG
jgi:hypothetical protein